MPVNEVEVKMLAAIVLFLLFLYFWLRRSQKKNKLERQRKLRCKELILDNRLKLANSGVNFDRLVDLVKQKILPEQLEAVIGMLTAQPVLYNIDDSDDPESLKIDLDFEGEPASSKTQRIDLPAIALAQASFRIPELGSRRGRTRCKKNSSLKRVLKK